MFNREMEEHNKKKGEKCLQKLAAEIQACLPNEQQTNESIKSDAKRAIDLFFKGHEREWSPLNEKHSSRMTTMTIPLFKCGKAAKVRCNWTF